MVTLQTIFPDSSALRLLHRNLTGICLFSFRSDQRSVKQLAQKLFPTCAPWFLKSHEHATTITQHGYLYIDTSNDTTLKEKYRVRNFLAPIYSKVTKVTPTTLPKSDPTDSDYLRESVVAIAKKDHQYLYADPKENCTF